MYELVRQLGRQLGEDEEEEMVVGWLFGQPGIPIQLGAFPLLFHSLVYRVRNRREINAIENRPPAAGHIQPLNTYRYAYMV